MKRDIVKPLSQQQQRNFPTKITNLFSVKSPSKEKITKKTDEIFINRLISIWINLIYTEKREKIPCSCFNETWDNTTNLGTKKNKFKFISSKKKQLEDQKNKTQKRVGKLNIERIRTNQKIKEKRP